MKLIEKLAQEATVFAENSTQDFFFGYKTGFVAARKMIIELLDSDTDPTGEVLFEAINTLGDKDV